MLAPIASLARLVVIALSALLLPAVARAQEKSPPDVPASERVDPGVAGSSAEVARMAAVMSSQIGTARLWYWGWTGFYGAVIIGETVVNGVSTGPMQTSADVNVVTSVLGLFTTLLMPPPVAFDWEPVSALPENTPEQRAAKSVAIRAIFDRQVKKERFYHSALNHIIGLTVNAAVCAYMYWVLHIGGRTLLNLFAGSLIWEANIYTSPNASSRAADEIQGTSSLELQLVPIAVGPTGAGLGLVGRF
jgi:hypothetical protein